MVLGEHHESEVRLAAVFKGDRPIARCLRGNANILNRTNCGPRRAWSAQHWGRVFEKRLVPFLFLITSHCATTSIVRTKIKPPHHLTRRHIEHKLVWKIGVAENPLRLPRAWSRAFVIGQWTNNSVIGVLLHDMRRPTRNATRHENRRVLRHWNAKNEIRHTAREIHIGVNGLVLQHDGLNAIANIKPLLGVWTKLIREFETP